MCTRMTTMLTTNAHETPSLERLIWKTSIVSGILVISNLAIWIRNRNHGPATGNFVNHLRNQEIIVWTMMVFTSFLYMAVATLDNHYGLHLAVYVPAIGLTCVLVVLAMANGEVRDFVSRRLGWRFSEVPGVRYGVSENVCEVTEMEQGTQEVEAEVDNKEAEDLVPEEEDL